MFATTPTATMREVRVHIRWMIRRDMSEVLGIEEQSNLYPWSEDDFLRYLRQRNCIGMVAEVGEQVIGFMIYELHKTRLHVLNFSVHPHFRRMDVGSQMVGKLIGKLSNHRRNCITVALRETNLAAQIFFRQAGFRAVRVARSHFADSGEDAYLMQYRMHVEQSMAA